MKSRELVFLSLGLLSLSAWSEESLEWSAEIEIGYGHDSNIVIDDVDLATERGDRFIDVGLASQLGYSLSEKLDLTIDALVSEKRYQNIDDFDGRLSMLSAGLERSLGNFDFGLNARYIDYQLDGDDFLALKQVTASLSTFPSRRTYTRFSYEISEETFEVDPDRDNTQDRFSLRGYLFLSGLQRYLVAGLSYASDDAEVDVFNSTTREASLSFRQILMQRDIPVTVELSYRYSLRDYRDEVHPLLGDFRHDRRRRLTVSADWKISQRLSVKADVYKNDYRSNLATADYDQGVGQLTVKYVLTR